MTTKISEKETPEEIDRAFQLFDQQGNDEITFENLKRIAVELGETMTDDELKLMIFEANKTDKYIIVINNFNLKLNIRNIIINI